MKHVPSFLKRSFGEYVAIFIVIGIIVLIISALLGPAVGNVFSNIYANVLSPDNARSASNTQPTSSSNTTTGAKAAVNAPYRVGNMIIKNGEMTLLVANTDRAVDQVTTAALDLGGYLISNRVWQDKGLEYAQVTMGIPSEQFEAAQRRMRALAVQVLVDTATGQDVSEEYVDLQSRANNLEATATRIRDFLKDAKDAEQALAVNNRLTEVEAELEQVKGRMQYLRDRVAYSTLTVNLEPQRPTPTPEPTPTPIVWHPDKTVEAAGNTLGSMLRALGDLAIWLGITVAPFVVPVALISTGVWQWKRKQKKM